MGFCNVLAQTIHCLALRQFNAMKYLEAMPLLPGDHDVFSFFDTFDWFCNYAQPHRLSHGSKVCHYCFMIAEKGIFHQHQDPGVHRPRAYLLILSS